MVGEEIWEAGNFVEIPHGGAVGVRGGKLAQPALTLGDLSVIFEFCPICPLTGHFMTVESRQPVALLQLIRIRIVLIQVQASTAPARSLCAKVDCFAPPFMLQVSVG
jgi:hypothetical protein